MKLSIRPIENWPGELRTASQRVRSPFDSSYSDTMELLDRELRMLGAKASAVQIAVNEGQIRRDGQLYASARPDHPTGDTEQFQRLQAAKQFLDEGRG